MYIYIHTYIHTNIYMYICIYICVCVCVCMLGSQSNLFSVGETGRFVEKRT